LEERSLTNLSAAAEDYPGNDTFEENEISVDTFEEEFNVDEDLQEEDYNGYGSNYGGDDDEQQREIPIAMQDSFFERLQNQLDLLALSDKQYLIGNQIIGSLDDDGYLRRPVLALIDDLAFSQNVMADENEVEEMLM